MPRTPHDTPHTTKPGWTLLRRDYPHGEERAVCFYERDGVFCFVIERWFGPYKEANGMSLDDAYWSEDSGSGLFGSLESAEREAERVFAMLPP